MTYRDQLEMILESIDARRSICYRELKHLPVGELRIEKNGKYQQLRRYYRWNEKIIRESIGRNPELIDELKRRAYYEEEVRILDRDYELIRNALDSVTGNEFQAVLQKMKPELADLAFGDTFVSAESGLLIPRPTSDADTPVHDLELQLGDIDPHEWATMPYRENTSFSEEKHHIGSTGLHYRSRAELTIFEHIITKRRHPVHYDELIDIDGEWFSPDGIVPNARNEIILIEYMEINDPGYFQKNSRKITAYHRKGFVLGRNLLVLSCETNGFINIPKLDKILDAYLLA